MLAKDYDMMWDTGNVTISGGELWGSLYQIHQETVIKRAWQLSISAVLWMIWLMRNETVFKGVLVSSEQFLNTVR